MSQGVFVTGDVSDKATLFTYRLLNELSTDSQRAYNSSSVEDAFPQREFKANQKQDLDSKGQLFVRKIFPYGWKSHKGL